MLHLLVRFRFAVPLALVATLAACAPRSNAGLTPSAFRTAASGSDWELRELRGAPAPTGAGGRRATLRFEPDTARVAGFAGCNRYFGTYTLDGRTLRFGPIGMTKMACAEGMELEQQLGAAFEATRGYELSASDLTLLGESGAVARFARAQP